MNHLTITIDGALRTGADRFGKVLDQRALYRSTSHPPMLSGLMRTVSLTAPSDAEA